MKKNRHFMLRAAILMVMAVFTFTAVNAQEEKEEKKVIKIKMKADEDGNVTMDTTIVLDEDFDGDWESVTDDEELLKKLKDIHVDIEGERNMTYVVKTVDGDHEGEEKIMIWHSEDGDCKDKKGDKKHSIQTYTIKVDENDGEKEVMVWSSDGEEHEDIEVILEELGGDSIKVMVVTAGGDDEDIKIVKKKEIIIITEDVDEEKENKKKKKKKK